MASGDTTTERLELDVVLDPEGLRSQLAQVKQQIGLELAGTSYSLNQTAGAFGAGFNSMSRDAGALINAVMFQPTPTQDLGGRPASILSGLVPGLTAPRSYDVEEWGKLHRDSIFNSTADASYRLGLAVPNVVASQVGFGVGMSAGWAATGAPMAAASVKAMTWGPYLGASAAGMAGGLVGVAVAGAATDAVMDPFVGRYMAGQALSSGGARFGIGKGQDYLDSFSGAQASSGLSGVEAAGVLRTGLEQGAFGQVGSAEEFSTKFRSLMRGAKSIAQEMHVELNDAVQSIASMQSSGFGSIESSVGALRMSRTTAALTGITNAEAIALSQAGAGMTVGNLGMSAQYGASATRAHFEGVTLGLRDKTVDMESITQLGGRARAAQAMTMSGLGFLEGPLGRATLLGAYDSETGTLDQSKFMVEPGAAFNQAIGNVFSGANPMRTLLEFAGDRQRVASQASPEEVALAQASTWQALARHIDPKGPVTENMLVGAATQFGVNPDVARAVVGTLKPEVIAARQEELMKQAAIAAQAEFGRVGGVLGRGGSLGEYSVGGFGRAVGKAAGDFSQWRPAGMNSLQDAASLAKEVVWGTPSTIAGNLYNSVYEAAYGVNAPPMMITRDILAGSLPGKNTMAADLARAGSSMETQRNIDDYLKKADESADALFARFKGVRTASQDTVTQALLKFSNEFDTILSDPKSPEAVDLRNRMLEEAAGMSSAADAGVYSDIVTAAFDSPVLSTVRPEVAAKRGRMVGWNSGGRPGIPGTPELTMLGALTNIQQYGKAAMSTAVSEAGVQYLSQFEYAREAFAKRGPGMATGTALANVMGGMLQQKDLSGTPFQAMGKDYQALTAAMKVNGGEISMENLRNMSADFQGFRQQELLAAAQGEAGGTALTLMELKNLAAQTASAYGISRGYGGGGGPAGSTGAAAGMAGMSKEIGRAHV